MSSEYLSLSVSTGAVSCYPALMVNFIWFTDEKLFIVSALSNTGAWNQASHNPKSHPSRKHCVLMHGLAERCKSQAISISVRKWSFWALFLWLQWQNFNSLSSVKQISKADEVHHQSSVAIQQVRQHQLQQASLYSWHIITSALYND